MGGDGGGGGGDGGGAGGAGGSIGGGIGGKMGLEMETTISCWGMPRSPDSWLRIKSGVSAAMRSAASAGPPCCVTTMRAVTACSWADETDAALPPSMMAVP